MNFDRVLMEPKPVQRPHPPVWVGGLGPTVIDRVLAFGDAWFPNWTPDIIERAAELRSRVIEPQFEKVERAIAEFTGEA